MTAPTPKNDKDRITLLRLQVKACREIINTLESNLMRVIHRRPPKLPSVINEDF